MFDSPSTPDGSGRIFTQSFRRIPYRRGDAAPIVGPQLRAHALRPRHQPAKPPLPRNSLTTPLSFLISQRFYYIHLLSLHFLPHPGVRPCSSIHPLFIAGALLPVTHAAIRQHTLELTYGTNNADGTTRESWLIIGQTPGPHLVWDEGDDISVKVVNKGHEPVTMHWHGIEQVGSLWSDGVPGLTQWPIPVQGDFVYNLPSSKLASTGTTLTTHDLHSPRPNKPKPFSQISTDAAVLEKLKQAENNALLLNVYDYKHYTSEHWMAEWERTDIEQLCIDNLLTNGKGPVICPDMNELNAVANAQQKPLTKKGAHAQMQPSSKLMYPYPGSKPDIVEPAMWTECTNSNTTFEVFSAKQSNGWVAFNLLNSGALWDLRVSINSHKLYFYPDSTSLLIPVGKFFVKLNQTPGNYCICAAVVLPQLITGFSILCYSDKTGTGLVQAKTLPPAKKPWINYAGNLINSRTDLVMANLALFPDLPPLKATLMSPSR
ncbi:Multicopper oxidase [Rhizoctonia solani]|uniref:Multicopper oxidase n=1 Tax=Rhizoctonia solani TaxID=456999 RepID=A0A8H8NNE7_9AGAM|nr:Multicopper oxidase [Rhizoctonia solani]QRW15645.1 Multicopper oxidase [Rhizoctonia solani]